MHGFLRVEVGVALHATTNHGRVVGEAREVALQELSRVVADDDVPEVAVCSDDALRLEVGGVGE